MAEMIDLTKSDQYTLTIRISTDGFSFSVNNPLIEKSLSYIPYKVNQTISLAANLRAAFQDVDILSLTYKNVNILLANSPVTTVPLEQFEEEHISTMYYQNYPELANHEVMYNILSKAKLAVLFSIEKITHQLLHEKYPEARYFASFTPLLSYFYEQNENSECARMYAYIQKKQMDIFCFDRNKLQLHNSFACSETYDRVYYMLYIWKQLGMNQRHDELHLCGASREKTPAKEVMKKYINEIYAVNALIPSEEGCEPDDIDKVPFDVQTKIVCVL